jgi:hypothetical protein
MNWLPWTSHRLILPTKTVSITVPNYGSVVQQEGALIGRVEQQEGLLIGSVQQQ